MTRSYDMVALRASIGTHLGFSRWHQITQEQIDAFARATGDQQWIHTDTERAQRGPFGTTVAHGLLTLSLLPTLTAEVYSIDEASMHVNYGTEKVRFPAPVPSGSKVRVGVELRDVTPHRLGTLVTTHCTVELAGSDKPACVTDLLALVMP